MVVRRVHIDASAPKLTDKQPRGVVIRKANEDSRHEVLGMNTFRSPEGIQSAESPLSQSRSVNKTQQLNSKIQKRSN